MNSNLIIQAGLTDPQSYVWYKYRGPRLRFTLKSGIIFHLERGDEFGLRADRNTYRFLLSVDGDQYRCKISEDRYAGILANSVLLKQTHLSYYTVNRRIRLTNRSLLPALTKLVQNTQSTNQGQKVLYLVANTLYAMLHCYGVALSRIHKASVSSQVIHDPFVAKLIAFLVEGEAIKEVPKTRIDGYEMTMVIKPPPLAVHLEPDSKRMFLGCKKALLKFLDYSMPRLLTQLVRLEDAAAMSKCHAYSREAVLLCAIMGQVMSGNHTQAQFDAKNLRFTKLF